MPSVAVNPPKTPVTKGSSGIAAATVPNVCKMPGPPAPFVPTPLPNIGKSGNSPDGYSTSVKIEGEPVAIRGASFKSMGDVASQGTGGGIVSNNVEGPTKFIPPGSLDVQIEGKNVHHLGDQMLNNNGPSGSPPNAATMTGEVQGPALSPADQEKAVKCAVKQCDEMEITEDHRSRMSSAMAAAKKEGKDTSAAACMKLGTIKHECVEKKMKATPGARTERTYDMRQNPPTVLMRSSPNEAEECSNFWSGMASAFRACGGRANYNAGDARRPDVVFGPEPGAKNVFDAKFPCSAAVLGGDIAGSPLRSNPETLGRDVMDNKQRDAYEKIADGGKVKAVAPADAAGEACEPENRR